MGIKVLEDKDIIIVGSGIGGLVAAKKASDQGLDVMLVSSSKFGGGASFFPLKGTLGIQATASFQKDEKLFYEDIARVGLRMDNPHMVQGYIKNIRKSIDYLKEIGFEPWLRGDNRPACFAKYPRDIYLINNWDKARDNGKKIFDSIENITIKEECKIVKILQRDGAVKGVIFQNGEEEFFLVRTKAIIMATGGVAGLYKHNLYPTDVDGTGHIVALDAGAKVVNMEFIQFIPAFISPKYNTLYGEHTAKYVLGMYDLNGKLIYPGIDSDKKDYWLERSSYAPFSCDFKSFEIDLAMIKAIGEGSEGVELKFHKDLYEDKGEFYTVYLSWLKDSLNIDMCRDKIVIAPFAHGCNGGVMVTDCGETGVKGLFAIGELSSSVEGANRLGGNSVGGALVFGNRAALKAWEYIANLPNETILTEDLIDEFISWKNEILKDNKNTSSLKENEKNILELKKIMTLHGGIKREEKSLDEGLEKLKNIKPNSIELYLKIESAKLLLNSMKMRKESRGAHYREDFPKRDSKTYRVIVSRLNNKFKVEKEYL
ncbi:FAD-binding protein [Cetobacterium somerae]|uniref:FAD-binding protein n=1 Tax=Cetobacterium sp. NK01 TaxID=2993530 RepID=UPI00211641DC|nr:FAD-binding protein [Cetobacterium sp. NK01]MCQ8212137.1 FAD-binding protein [Cetobacterium sp. NK01]